MDKQEFLKQMIFFGQELLTQEQESQLHTKAINKLEELYDYLDRAINAAADLEIIFGKKDKRSLKAKKAVGLISSVQELMNPMAEDKDIQLC